MNRDDRPRRLRVLLALADVCETRARLAELIGVAPNTLSQWFSGDRDPEEWHVLLSTAAKVLRHYPASEAQVVQAIVAELLDVQGAWLPALECEDGRSLVDDASDGVEAAVRVLGAARREDMAELRGATRELANKAIGLAARSAA